MKRRIVRRLACVGMALTVVALAFGVTVCLLGPEPPGVTAANFRRIRKGMTLSEVETLLGGPPQLAHQPLTWLNRKQGGRLLFGDCWERAWLEGDRAILVFFDEDDRVRSAHGGGWPEASILDRLRSLLSW